jgi:hypothetical protein
MNMYGGRVVTGGRDVTALHEKFASATRDLARSRFGDLGMVRFWGQPYLSTYTSLLLFILFLISGDRSQLKYGNPRLSLKSSLCMNFTVHEDRL